MLAALTTPSQGTLDVLLIIAAVLFFVAALLHLYRQTRAIPPTALAFCLMCLGLTATAIALLFS
jgi:hypothetical protein